jgi:4-hydroxy-tetrahydrodipicolinate synthase
MATPFFESGDLDIDGAISLARYLSENGSDALAITGTTGEVSTLDDKERMELYEAVSEAVTVPVIVGSTSNDTRHSIELTKSALATQAAGILAVAPYYSRPNQSGIKAHFTAVAEAAGSLEVIIYDIPVRTGRKVATFTLLELAQDVKNITCLKDAAQDVSETAKLLRDAPEGFFCYSGDDALTLPLLSVGAIGVISVASHWCAPLMQDMIEQFMSGNIEEAVRINRSLVSSYEFETGELHPNPLPTKAMLKVMGLPSGPCRLPLGNYEPWLLDKAAEVLEGVKSRMEANR